MAHPETEAVGSDAGSDYTVFGKFLDAPEASAEDLQETPEGEPLDEDSGEPDTVEAEAEADMEATEEAESDEDPQPEAIDPPHSWSKADKEYFKSLPPEAQRVVAERERQRDSFLTQRSEALAAERKEIEAQRAEAEKARREYAERLQAFQVKVPTPPDESLIDENPVEYLRQQRAYEAAQVEAKRIAEERSRLEAEEAERQKAAYENFVKEQAKVLADLVPEYRDEKTRKQFISEVNEYALKRGYEPRQLEWASARDIETLHKARLYDAIQEARKTVPEKLRDVPKVAKPGQSTSKTEMAQAKRQEQLAKLRKTGSLQDAAAVFKSIL